MKAKIFLGFCILSVTCLTPWLYRHGQSKYVYKFHPIDKFVPIPNIYDNFTATAIFLDEDQVKVSWNYASAPEAGAIFTCRGWINTPDQAYYLLEYDQRFYVEKGEHIEPLIQALCALSRGGPQNNHPDKISEAIACLPDDREVMLALVRKFKKPVVPRT